MNLFLRYIQTMILIAMAIKGFDVLNNSRIMYDLSFSIDVIDPLAVVIGILVCMSISIYTMIVDGANKIDEIEKHNKEN